MRQAAGMTEKQNGALPESRAFLMGNGVPVPPKVTGEFCNALVNGCLNGESGDDYKFILGFAACFDAISRGTIDLHAKPISVLRQAWSDVNNVTCMPNKVTDIMRIESETL